MNTKLLIITTAVFSFYTSVAHAAVGVVTTVRGEATVQHEAKPQAQPVKFKDELFWLDTYNTGPQSGLRLLVLDKSVITLKELSQLQLREESVTPGQPRKKNVVNLVSGAARTVVEKDALKDADYEIRTSRAIAGIRGSDLVGVVGTALNDQLQRAGLPRVPNNNCVAFITGPGSTSGVVAPQVGNTDMGPLDLLIVCDQFTHNPVTGDQFDDISNLIPPDPPPPPPDGGDGGGGDGPPGKPPGFFPPARPPQRSD
jgi:FecR-like protein